MHASEALTDGEALRTMFAPGSPWACDAGTRVNARRKALGWSLDKLAELADTHPSTVSRIENGLVVPRQHLMAGLAYALTCEIDQLWPMPTRRDIHERAAA